jgi:hypothetical protein
VRLSFLKCYLRWRCVLLFITCYFTLMDTKTLILYVPAQSFRFRYGALGAYEAWKMADWTANFTFRCESLFPNA